MSLDNIQISSHHLRNLYTKSLVDLDPVQAKSKKQDKTDIVFLGNNEKHITILVNDEKNAFLDESELELLVNILRACNIYMADVSLININQSVNVKYENIQSQLKPAIILFFGVDPSKLDFPLSFPHYQVQEYNNQVYLSAPDLATLTVQIEEKKKLWGSIKNIFNG